MVDAAIEDRGSTPDPFDRAIRERPPPRDTGGPLGTNDAGMPIDSNTPSDADPPREAGIVTDADSGPLSSESILAIQSADCLACAKDNGCLDPTQMGGICETVEGNALKGGLTEVALCLEVLNKIFDSKCAATLSMTPCLCGATDSAACLAGTAIPTGPLYQDYLDEWPFGGVGSVVSNFTNQGFGAGMANALVQCVAAFECTSCFGISTPRDGGAD